MRILVVSHTPLNYYENNGRTLNNLVNSFSEGQVSQLFFHEGNIESKKCKDYYCISDFDVINSIKYFSIAGNVVLKNDEAFSSPLTAKKTEIYGAYSHKSSWIRLLRDLAWGVGTWKSRRLKQWLKEISPDVILFYASDAVFSQKIASWVQGYLKKPMIMYFVDDYYLKLKFSYNLIANFNIWRFKRICKHNILNSTCVCITPMMAEAYNKEFGKKFDVLYTSSFVKSYPLKKHQFPLIISYLGNISLGRYISIATIGKIIKENKLPFVLNVYSSERRENILCQIRDKPGVNFHGSIDYSEVQKVMSGSDILLHVEDFDQKNIDFCRYSLSTKIADSLCSNRCLLAFGPQEVASIDYLLKMNCSPVASSEEMLKEILKKIANDPAILDQYAYKAIEVAKINHSLENNNTKLNLLLHTII